MWHEDVSCKDAMNNQLLGWAEENKDNVSMCPMCNTRIEKNKGCNHMTCAFCKYEFCWACGESATNAENHFGALRGCGVAMMDENVKPGDHLKIQAKSKCKRYAWYFLKIFLIIIFFPVILVFWLPYKMIGESIEKSRGRPCFLRFLNALGAFLCSLFINLFFIPCMIMYILMTIVNNVIYYTFYILFCCCIIKCIR